MAYGDFKDLTRRTASHKILCDKTFSITKNLKYDGYQRASMIYKFFDEKNLLEQPKNEFMSDKELAEELHKPIIRKFKDRKVYSSYTENIDLDLKLNLDKFRFLLWVIDIYSKYS